MAKNENRCWPGYEPVKGKPAHSQGSCRPKAESKLTGSEKEFRSKRRKQLDKWEAEHPDTRKSASQHLHAPNSAKKATKKAPAKKTASRKPAARKTGTKKRAAAKKKS